MTRFLITNKIREEIKKEIKICMEKNEKDNMTTPNLWDSVRAVLRGRFIAIQAYLKKQEKKSNKNSNKSNFTPKATRKRRNEQSHGR